MHRPDAVRLTIGGLVLSALLSSPHAARAQDQCGTPLDVAGNGAVEPLGDFGDATRCSVGRFILRVGEDGPDVLYSGFDGGLEGWTQFGATSMTAAGGGGNPGGYLHIDNSEGPITSLFAPSSFFGNLSGLVGGIVSFDGNMLGVGGADWLAPSRTTATSRSTAAVATGCRSIWLPARTPARRPGTRSATPGPPSRCRSRRRRGA
jgi:hypothetical protein